MNETFDYIIVGAGSAGCVLADRLTESGRNNVMLIEAGGKDTNPWIHVPIGFAKTMFDPSVNWCYRLEPDAGVGNRQIYYPRGKVLGVSSSINGLIYIRGQREDYDHWRQLGNDGWGWDDVFPLFLRSEKYEGEPNRDHGCDGQLRVSQIPHGELCDAFIASAELAGYRSNPDFNGATQEGFGYFQVTSSRGRRCSAATAFLKPAARRPNLKIVTRALVQKIRIEGRKATGVVFSQGLEQTTVQVRKSVIVCAGAFNTPALLQLSGIGPGSLLREHGIPVIQDLPGVGENLQDHLHVKVVHRASRSITLNDQVGGLLGKMKVGAQYALFRTGALTVAAGQVGGFIRTRPDLTTSDIQYHFLTYSTDNPKDGLHPFPGFTTTVAQLRPESRGTVRIRSNDPTTAPAIRCNYLSTPLDLQTTLEGVKAVRRIAAAGPLAALIEREERPGAATESDDALCDYIRNNAISLSHAAGSCRMGRDKNAVVDPQLWVHGVENLMIADASIMPSIVSGNTNAAAIMIGEKAADLVRAADGQARSSQAA